MRRVLPSRIGRRPAALRANPLPAPQMPRESGPAAQSRSAGGACPPGGGPTHPLHTLPATWDPSRSRPPRPAPPRPRAPGPCPSSGPDLAAPRTDTWRDLQGQTGYTRRPRSSCGDSDASQSLRCACCPAPRGRPCRPLARGGGLATNRRGPAPRPGAAHPGLGRGAVRAALPRLPRPAIPGGGRGRYLSSGDCLDPWLFIDSPHPPPIAGEKTRSEGLKRARDWTSRPAFFPGLSFQAFASRNLPCVQAARLYWPGAGDAAAVPLNSAVLQRLSLHCSGKPTATSSWLLVDTEMRAKRYVNLSAAPCTIR
ncbi:unnamed protein product [Rangifer tarandus platyrhynchus]|uniref:Uncharacterized protein n=2 Tax=Rangifer tarandus platyrhynchus TaxID=3082113 RepID=A0ABN8ZXG6_RANTA|nr:unnamed protein product [Rangifer tarandus platyrhynchus]CAI9711306.1 unnamed protein product [Rangifer tarandus platyrhynchus]